MYAWLPSREYQAVSFIIFKSLSKDIFNYTKSLFLNLTLLAMRVCLTWQRVPCHMHYCRGKTCHAEGKSDMENCHTTTVPTGFVGPASLFFEPFLSFFFQTIPDENEFYINMVALNMTYNLLF